MCPGMNQECEYEPVNKDTQMVRRRRLHRIPPDLRRIKRHETPHKRPMALLSKKIEAF